MTICSATRWPTNADMIVDIVELGYIRPTDRVIDLTYGQGLWWAKYDHPGEFVANIVTGDDLMEGRVCSKPFGFVCNVDYRRLDGDAWTDSFDVVAFDPPYVAMGGRGTSTMTAFMGAYGLFCAAATPELLQADNNLGLATAWNICKPGGLVLAKCAPYISSGVRKDGDWWTRDAALELGFKIEDMLIHVGDVRAQPKDGPCRKCKGTGATSEPNCRCDAGKMGTNDDAPIEEHDHSWPCEKCSGTGRIPRKVKHARNNYSVLWVFRKPKPRKPRKPRKKKETTNG